MFFSQSHFQTQLAQMTVEEFNLEKKALRIKYLQKMVKQEHRMDEYWREISGGRYYFNRADYMAVTLDIVQKDDITYFFQVHFSIH